MHKSLVPLQNEFCLCRQEPVVTDLECICVLPIECNATDTYCYQENNHLTLASSVHHLWEYFVIKRLTRTIQIPFFHESQSCLTCPDPLNMQFWARDCR